MSLISTLSLDLRYTLRQLRRAPGFTATAVVTLALGIGATTAMYSIVRATLLAALPYPHPNELVGIGFSQPTASPNAEQTGETADFLMADSTSFASIGVADGEPRGQNLAVSNERGGTSSLVVRSLRISAGYLPTLGVAPLLGRNFTHAEDLPGAAPTAILSEAFWRRAFAADPHILGRTLHLNGDPYTVIGVMRASFATADVTDLWQPLHLSSADPGYIGYNFQLIARLKPGVPLAQAASELTSLTPALYRQCPNYLKWGDPAKPNQELLWPLQQVVASQVRPSLLALAAAVLAVLLMACLNLAGLLTARSAARQGEISLRSALGATRFSSLRLLLTESIVLALSGSLLGLLVAQLVLPLLLRNSPIDLPQLQTPTLDPIAILFAILLGCATTLLFGLLPALGAFGHSLSIDLSHNRASGSRPRQRLGRTLLVAQVALATVLLSVGAVLLGTFLRLRATPSGVRPEQLSVLQVNLRGSAYNSSLHTQQFIAAVGDRLRGLPGVTGVAAVNGLPLDRGLNNSGWIPAHPEHVDYVETRFVTPGYFRTTGTALLAGNDVSLSDLATTQPVALINQRAARMWFPDRSPIGETVVDGGEKKRVIGIVADVSNRSLAAPPRPTVYLPYAQIDDDIVKAINGWFPTTFVLRTASNLPAADLARAASAAVTAVDPEVPASKFATMQTFIDHTVAAPRFFSFLAGAFALFALLLTAIGLFGLLSYQVTARTREIGVRMALGAQRSQILTLVLRTGLALTAIGLTLSIAGSFALRRVLASFLATATEVRTSDLTPLLASQTTSVALAATAMLGAAVAASLIPAHRAASIEPTTALRAE